MADARAVFPVEGMSCGMCAATVERRLLETTGVRAAHVNFATGEASVALGDGGIEVADLVRVVREAGFDCAKTSAALDVAGLRDAIEVARLERAIRKLPGVISVSANQATERVAVEYVPGSIGPRDLENAVVNCGMSLAPPVPTDDPAQRAAHQRHSEIRDATIRFSVAALMAVLTTLGSLPLITGSERVDVFGRLLTFVAGPVRALIPQLWNLDGALLAATLFALTAVSVGWAGMGVFLGAWRGLQRSVSDGNTLVAVAAGSLLVYSICAVLLELTGRVGALGAPAFHAVNWVIAFSLLGRWVEAHARARAAELAEGLGRLPAQARVERDGIEQDISVDELLEGDRVIVGPGETIAADGVVITGETQVDESILFGSSLPVPKRRDDHVVGGTSNLRGSFAFEVTSAPQRSAVHQFRRMVHLALDTKSTDQRRVEGVARFFVPAVLVVAIAVMVATYVMGGPNGAVVAILAFTGVVAAACPCLFGVATPAAVVVAVGKGAEHGIVARDAATLEAMHRVNTIVFDKTGTITEGRPTVTHILGAKRTDGSTVSPAEILRLAAAVEARSSHPLAEAIVNSAADKGIEVGTADRFRAMSGRGVRGIVGRFLVEVISIRHARERSLDLGRLGGKAERHVLAGRMPVVVVVNDTVQGLIVVTDTIKPTAKAAVGRLKEMGYDLFLLSGDSKVSAGLAAKEIGIDRVIAGVDPEDKADEIKRLQDDGRTVAMVGDGITDAPALAQADVGISVGCGRDIAAKASDFSAIRDDLWNVPAGAELGRRATNTIRNNVRLAVLYNLLAIPLAAGIGYSAIGYMIGPVVGIVLATTVRIAVVLHSLHLRKFQPVTPSS